MKNFKSVDASVSMILEGCSFSHLELHGGKTCRMGYETASFGELAERMTAIVGQPFRYEALAPEVFLEAMRGAGAEMAYMHCVYDHWKRYAGGNDSRR